MGSSGGFVLETEGISSGAPPPPPPPPQLPLFSLSLRPMKSSSLPATHYGKWLVTPPHHAASIPFRWEEEPGKPRVNCCKSDNQLQLALYHDYDGGDVNTNNGDDDDDDDHLMFKSLELPPRLQYNKNSKTPSPTTVLKGPYVIGKSIFHSFRMSGDRHRIRNGSASFDAGDEVAVVVSKRGVNYKGNSNGSRRRKLLGLWPGKKQKGNYDKRREEAVDDEFGGSDKDSFDFSSVSCGGDDDSGENWDRRMEMKKSSKTTTNSLGLTKAAGGSHFWANIYGAVKQVVIPTSRRNKATKR